MDKLNRREAVFAGLAAAAGVAAGIPGARAQVAAPSVALGQRPRVVIIGGGPGGGTLAHILRRGSPQIDVTLIEAKARYTTCFFSNLYLGGFRTLESLTHDYAGLTALGVNMVTDRATDINTSERQVTLQSGGRIAYDVLVLAPGIDFKNEAIPGYSRETAEIMPHAYQGGEQTELLHRQLQAMRDGGVVVVAPPTDPYRCPPGPYERVCLIAHYLKTRKPKSKLILIDPKKSFSKQALFQQAFQNEYKGIVEVHVSNELDNFALSRVDARSMQVETVAGLKIKADVANIIPPQQAAWITRIAGCTEGDWCPIDAESFRSTKVPNVFVIGDSAAAGDMPKSAFSANSQAKVVSNELEARLAEKPRYPARYRNTCWSMLGPDNSVKIGGYYRPQQGKVQAQLSFVSDNDEDGKSREKSFKESIGWYAGIIAETFNKRVTSI